MRTVLTLAGFLVVTAAAASTWTDVAVPLPDRTAVDALQAEGFTVRSVRGGQAVLYADEDDLARLEALGYAWTPIEGAKSLGEYPAFETVVADLEALAAAHPDRARVEVVGESVQGRPLLALVISDNAGVEEAEPEVGILSTFHGDEPLGTLLTLYLAERLLAHDAGDARARRIVDETELWLLPCANPDGYAAGLRFNAAGRDLNRDFPRYPGEFTGALLDGAPLRDAGRQPETAALMRWTAQRRFVLSTNLHTGALVFNYPYDDDGGLSGVAQPAPDEALFVALGEAYAGANPPMAASPWFDGGITNGAAWYVIRGGFQDWAYRYLGSLSVTLELSDDKAPPASRWADLWADNEESLLRFVEFAHTGARGLVTDAESGAPLHAEVRVAGPDAGGWAPALTDPDLGDYHRPLLPGTYTLQASAGGYTPASVVVTVPAGGVPVTADFALRPVETPPPAAPCPAEVLFAGRPKVLATMRAFRDERLARSALGRWAIRGYYRAADWLVDSPIASGFNR